VTASSDGGSTSKAAVSNNGGTSTVVKKTTSLPTMPIKIISVTSPPEGSTKTTEQKQQPPRRRPMPKLIPIVEQQQQQNSRRLPSIIRMRLPVTKKAPPPPENATVITPDNYYSLAPGQSALSDFASIIDDKDCVADPLNCNPTLANAAACGVSMADRRRSSSSTGSSSTITSPKSKTASFFDKLKAKVDETADLTCPVCHYESKCLSEFMRHQRTHGDNCDADADVDATTHVTTASVDVNELNSEDHTATELERTTSTPPPLPPLPVTAAELKSTRCQRCRKRCKTSTELIVHLATCRGTTAIATTTPATAINIPSQPAAVKETVTDEELDTRLHPMENKIFVWNTSAVATPPGEDDGGDDIGHEEKDSVSVSEVAMPLYVEPPSVEDGSEDDVNDSTSDNTGSCDPDMLQHQEQMKRTIRKEGKMYKTVIFLDDM